MSTPIIATEGDTIIFYDRPVFFEVETDDLNGFAMVTESNEKEERLAVFLFDEDLRTLLHEDAMDLLALCTHPRTKRYTSEVTKDFIEGTKQFRIHPVESMADDHLPNQGAFWSDYSGN